MFNLFKFNQVSDPGEGVEVARDISQDLSGQINNEGLPDINNAKGVDINDLNFSEEQQTAFDNLSKQKAWASMIQLAQQSQNTKNALARLQGNPKWLEIAESAKYDINTANLQPTEIQAVQTAAANDDQWHKFSGKISCIFYWKILNLCSFGCSHSPSLL